MSHRSSRFHTSDGNNQAQPPVVLFSHLSETEKEALLNNNGYLHGIRIDGNDCPRKSIQAVARYKIQGQHHSPVWIEEQDNIISETITTKKSRNLNYVHSGWSVEAASTVPLSANSRVAQRYEANSDGDWTTKRTTIQRLSLDIPLEDLVPSLEFQAEIRAALGQSTSLDKFKALDKVFQYWGDVIPIVFELGASLAISDLSSNFAQSSSTGSNFMLKDLAAYRTARVNIKGGDTSADLEEIIAWLSKIKHPSQWSMTRIIRVVPVTDLVQSSLKKEIESLYSTLLSYRPLAVEGNSIGGNSFDGTPYALKTISAISVRSDSMVDSLKVLYTDGTHTDQYGGSGGNEQQFCLLQEEFLVEVVVWTDLETTCGVQFVTNKGRISPHYGGDEGVPSVLNCDGGALSAFSVKVKKNSYKKKDMVYRIQTIWRHNLAPLGLTRGHHYSTYVGGTGGAAFNDWPYSRATERAYISGVAVRGEKYIESIQATYTVTHYGETAFVEGARHGVMAGRIRPFSLQAGEYFVKAQGRWDNYITQLCFVTNRGRSTPVHGGSGGEEFTREAPPGTRLCFIMGKSSKHLYGLLFVWAPVSI